MSLLIDTIDIYRCGRREYGNDARLIFEKFVPFIEDKYGPQGTKIAYVSYATAGSIKFASFLDSLGFHTKSYFPREIQVAPGHVWKNTDPIVPLVLDATEHSKDSGIILCSSDYRLKSLIDWFVSDEVDVSVWGVGVPYSFDCSTHNISKEFFRNGSHVAT